MKRIIFVICISFFSLPISSTIAANKVVVIPLAGSAKVAGTDGQIQYNDNGKTAGADIYFDKSTGKLEIPGEIRTVDGTGNNRLWGRGRPGTGLVSHTDPDGYCTTNAGIKHAVSTVLAAWGNAANACPQGTWVCEDKELSTEGACAIQPFESLQFVRCDGSTMGIANLTSLSGWISDAGGHYKGKTKSSTNLAQTYTSSYMCTMFRVWCCWE